MEALARSSLALCTFAVVVAACSSSSSSSAEDSRTTDEGGWDAYGRTDAADRGALADTSEDGRAEAPGAAIPLEGCLGVHAVELTVGGTQRFHVVIDTGSTTTAIAGSQCTTCRAAGVAPLYEPGPEAVDQQEQASSLYGTGDHGWEGAVYEDTMAFPRVPATRVKFVSIETEQSFFFPT